MEYAEYMSVYQRKRRRRVMGEKKKKKPLAERESKCLEYTKVHTSCYILLFFAFYLYSWSTVQNISIKKRIWLNFNYPCRWFWVLFIGTVLRQDKNNKREIVFLFDRLLLIDKHVISQDRKEQVTVGVLNVYSTRRENPFSFNIAFDSIIIIIVFYPSIRRINRKWDIIWWQQFWLLSLTVVVVVFHSEYCWKDTYENVHVRNKFHSYPNLLYYQR